LIFAQFLERKQRSKRDIEWVKKFVLLLKTKNSNN